MQQQNSFIPSFLPWCVCPWQVEAGRGAGPHAYVEKNSGEKCQGRYFVSWCCQAGTWGAFLVIAMQLKHMVTIMSSLAGAPLKHWWKVVEHIASGVLKALCHSAENETVLQMLVSSLAGEQTEVSQSDTAPQTLAGTDSSCAELQVLAGWYSQSVTGNAFFGPVSIWVQERLQNNGSDSALYQEKWHLKTVFS